MTTDITELALITIKNQIKSFCTVVLRENEALALAEALEKAQQVDEELCRLLPPGVEYMDPPDGSNVEPIEQVRRMVADYRRRIAELESRTVKLPPCVDDLHGIGMVMSADAVVEALTSYGIKVEQLS